MNAAAGWDDVRSIVCVRLDNMGDVLMSTPAFRALKALPGSPAITLLTSSAASGVAPFIPEVDNVIEYDAAWVKNGSEGNHGDRKIIEKLAQSRFEAAVIFTVYSQSALPAATMCHLAGIPLVLAHNRENPYRLLTHWVRESEPENGSRHEVQRQLDLVASVGAYTPNLTMSFRTRAADCEAMRACLHEKGIDAQGGWIVVHCGASAPSRRYGMRPFATVIMALRARGYTVVLTGSASERDLVDQIIELCGPGRGLVNASGCLGLGEFACLIEHAGLLVSNNTGPVHIASALGKPVVDIYALTNPQHTPWQTPHRVLYHDVPCRNCYRSICPMGHHACLSKLSPDEVIDAAIELLDAPNGPVQGRVLNMSETHLSKEGTCIP